MENNLNYKSKQPELSVVILCYRAGQDIYDFVRRVKRVFESNAINDYELILVGNFLPGEKDDTSQIVRDIANQEDKIKYIAQEKQGMMGWDMKSGLNLARGAYLAVIDGDGQMPAVDLARVFKEIKQKKCGLAKTFRLKRGDGAWRKLISWTYNLIFMILFPGLKARDINSKPKIMSREFYRHLDLSSDDWFIDAEIMISARRQKAVICEIPTEFRGLSGKRESFVGFSAIFEFIKNLAIFRLKEFFK